MPGERDIVKQLRQRAGNAGLALGIGDDCAIYRPSSGEELLFTTDLLLEDVHFRRSTHTARDIGHKTLARGLSDIAAMGGDPRFCFVSLASAQGGPWISRFYDGLLALAEAHRVTLAGGDLARAKAIACDIVVCGSTPTGSALRRSGARLGDAIYVSGALGGSALGLATRRGKAWQKHLRPEPRLKLGAFLRAWLHATAAMDLSDGLSLDLARLCEESGVAAEITMPPIFPGATRAQALDGGEDYELLFTVPAGVDVPATFDGIPLTRIGAIVRGKAGRVVLDGKPLAARGYDHWSTITGPKRRS